MFLLVVQNFMETEISRKQYKICLNPKSSRKTKQVCTNYTWKVEKTFYTPPRTFKKEEHQLN